MLLSDWIESAGERVLGLAARLESTLPVCCEAWSHSLGECTAYDGHTVGLKCQPLQSRPDKTDFLVLEIRIRSLSTEPVFEKAELAWNDFTAQPFKSPLRKPAPVSQSLLEELDRFWPRWESMLRRAVVDGVKQCAGRMLIMSRTIQDPDQVRMEASQDELELVHSSFLELFGPLSGEPLLLTPELAFPYVSMLADPSDALPGLQQETILDFRRRNEALGVFPEGFRLSDRPTEFLDSIVSGVDSDIRQIYRKFPRTPGHFSFSRPGWNLERNQALIVAFRHDGLHSQFRPQDDPLQSSHFSALCLLELAHGVWKLKGLVNWTKLVQAPDYEQVKVLGAQRVARELAEAGWEVQESEEKRLRLRNLAGNHVTVVTGDYLSDQLIGRVNEEPRMKFFTCADPVLIVPNLDVRFILEGLR